MSSHHIITHGSARYWIAKVIYIRIAKDVGMLFAEDCPDRLHILLTQNADFVVKSGEMIKCRASLGDLIDGYLASRP